MTVSGEAMPPLKRTVLIVDDDDIRSLIQLALRRASFEVVEASGRPARVA